jgi:hypothetical protein
MKKKRFTRDRVLKTLPLMGLAHNANIGGKQRIMYNRRAGYAIIKHPDKEKYGMVNSNNDLILDTKYDFCCYPKLGIIFVNKKGLWGFTNYSGDLICDCEYALIYSFKKGMAITRLGNRYGLVSIQGDVILKCKYTREKVLYERRKIIHRM